MVLQRIIESRSDAFAEKCRIPFNEATGRVGTISISIGVAYYCGGESSTDFIDRADNTPYSSKSRGRNRVTVAA